MSVSHCLRPISNQAPHAVPYLPNILTTGFVWDMLPHLWERRSGHTLAETLHLDWWAYLLGTLSGAL